MARKVFISILGTGFYKKCKYISGDFCSSNTRFAQQAVLEHTNAKEWSDTDTGIFLLTADARAKNWEISERENSRKEKESYTGLKNILNQLQYPFFCQDISIPDGKTEEEIWEIFSCIYKLLEEGDELYIDLTHSFRYLPMLLLVLSNYAKFLKKAQIKTLSYGNYEARDTESNKAPIIDLLPISALQDWTFAAANYLKNGNADNLVELTQTTIKPILKACKGANPQAKETASFAKQLEETSNDFQTCRGVNIYHSTHISALKKSLKTMQSTFIQPLNPLINQIEQMFSPFDDSPNIANGFAAAKWCNQHGLYQQAVTILQENITSLFCERNNISIDDEAQREIVNKALNIVSQKLIDQEEKWRIKTAEEKEKLKEILKDRLLQNKEIFNAFSRLTEIRNDINHSGMRSKQRPLKAQQIKTKISEIVQKVEETFLRLTD
ncbi:MAG: TIGR02221 family CRISPR-associated protein [Bacteroides pyogenes]|uniref:TIGR02221 family CRISPR-associated protein n=1 Tax=Bacteroides pyogenes TaxID=310300 RepID=UPI00242FF0ED|nr:TIGR02221 family CRISPR-associated protein [Bacteroides pyogenes]MCI7069913.1 TIGR02221 family CRISPR-associated protein [Bacteroides pyogenes]